jgi:hypothetical protein
MVRETISLGPDTNEGFDAEVVRAFDMDETDYYHTFVEYDLSGVESIRADSPDAVGPHADTLVYIEFVNGKATHILGVVTSVE